MSEPGRWSEGHAPSEPAEREVAELLRRVGRPQPWSPARNQQALRRLLDQAQARPAPAPHRWAVPAALLLALAALAGYSRWRGAGPVAPAVGLQAEPGARYTLGTPPAPGEPVPLEVLAGRVSAQGETRPLALRTPHLRARIEALSFWVQVAGDVTTVGVVQGRAWVERSDGSRLWLLAGQHLRSDDPRLAPPPTPPPAPARPARPAQPVPAPQSGLARCAGLAVLLERKACYTQLALGDSPEAQSALVELGVIEADEVHDGPSALEYWRSYQRRFPDGVLGAETSTAILAELVAERRTREAEAEADAFLARFGNDPRADEVRLTRASLGCAPGAEARSVLERFDQVLVRVGPGFRGEVLFARAVCQDHLGLAEDARAGYAAYLREFPTGSHAVAARARAGE